LKQQDIWNKYISAQVKILEHKSKPIGIDTSKEIQFDGLKLNLSVDQELFKRLFKTEVEKTFKINDFDYNSGYILSSIENTTHITNEELSDLKELSEICYIEFNENPVIEGTIIGNNKEIKENLISVIGELPTNYHFKNTGLIYLTIEEWKNISLIKNIKFEGKGGAVFPIKPSVSSLISTFYPNNEILQHGNKITVKGELHQYIYDLFQKHFNLTKKGNCLSFKFQNSELLKEQIDALQLKGITFPRIKDNCLIFCYDNKFYENQESDLNFEVFRLNRYLKKCFPSNQFEFSYSTDYSFDARLLDKGNDALEINEEVFWNRLFSEIHGDNFQISISSRTISFDFETEEELSEKMNFINSFSFLDFHDWGDKHKYKFNIKLDTGLHQLQRNLKKTYPNLFTKLIANGEKLIFRQYYKSGNKSEELSRLKNLLDVFLEDFEQFQYIINDTFQEKYLCEENFELKVEHEEEKLSKLVREDFYFGNPKEKKYLGKLQKIDYPELYFIVEEGKLEEVKFNIETIKIKAIFPDLKGEKDKIKRLEDTLLKLDSDQKLPNDNAKEFLFDSSKAKAIDNIEYLLNKSSAEWQEFENNLFSKNLNESQKQAIYKSLYAEELAIIQGPPGTGKSTAIAEIIWQHVKKNQREKILLTSETNLAVDNAIDRLKNEQNNFVKPIRFGKTDNLESEGYFYSLEAIDNWQKGKETQSNTVAHWIGNISDRITIQNDEAIDSALDKWKNHLKKPNIETRKLFANKYLEYVNLIGATGSSIGKLNSENKWTSFFHSYLNVFERINYEKSFNDKSAKSLCYRVDINFDTILMDEASKATPPELALPVIYGKKSIIVGDHRQLPPMIDGEEIKDLLISIGEKQLAKTLSNKEFEISQFERLFENIDGSIKGTFDTQFRMHPTINNVISQFYQEDGGLFCGLPLEETYHNTFDKWDSRYHGLKFKNIITPETHTIWINVNTPEIKDGTSRVNYGEVEAIDHVLTALKNCEGKREFDSWLEEQSIEEKQIGLISFYGKQISHLEKMLIQNHNDLYKGKGKENDKKNLIRLSTVDRFQGMERNIIIVSMVRSNKIASFQGQEPSDIYGELGYQLQDSLGFAESPNRLNVALSRARRLLIIVGNSEHFCRKPIYNNVFNTIQNDGKIVSAEELQNTIYQNE
jgi:superfamily I DNA and/or RNA helicase